jgi:predicted transposase/invertase (TIGR01784 family)
MQAQAMIGDSFENNHKNLCCRSIYYTSKLFIGQNAKHYSNLNQTFQIMVCGFTVFDDDRFIHRFHYADGGLILDDITCIIYVELPKIKSVIEKSFEEMTQDERWAVLIECANDKRFSAKVSEFKGREEFDMAINILSAVSKSELERMEYISHQKYQMDLSHNKHITQWIRQKAAEEGLQQGLEQGLQQGLQQGLEQGLEQGIEQGRQEAITDTAKNLLRNGVSPELVSAGTKLSLSEVEELQKQL